MKENIQNSTCEFAEELVSYLYDEIDGDDKSRFENHLQDCSPCSDELVEFSFARVSVQEWRDKEFVPLANPTIEILYPAKSSRSWFAQIRELFTLSPAWMTASTALAALAICVALLVILNSSQRGDNTEFVQQTGNKTTPSPTTGNQNQDSIVSNTNQDTAKPSNSPEPTLTKETPKTSPRTNEPVKIVTKPNVEKTPSSPVKTIQPKPNGKPNVKQQQVKPKNQKAPSFLDEEEEEKSLTLTDLLEEIGTKETDDKS